MYRLILPKLEDHYTYGMVSEWLEKNYGIAYSERSLISLMRRVKKSNLKAEKESVANLTEALPRTIAQSEKPTLNLADHDQQIGLAKPTLSLLQAAEAHKKRVEEIRKNTVGQLPNKKNGFPKETAK